MFDFILIALCALALVQQSSASAFVKEDYMWSDIKYSWPTKTFKNDAIKTGSYIASNNIPMGIALWKDKIFITVPRLAPGVASSLNYIKTGAPDSTTSPSLIPYPSWEANFIPFGSLELPTNSSIVSAFRIWVDSCDRLWVMDTGKINIFSTGEEIVQPSIVIFDLNNDAVIRRYYFDEDSIRPESLFVNIVVDMNGDCTNAFAYIADVEESGLVVYSFKANKTWRVEHHYFHFDPFAGNYSVGGVNFIWADGILGVAMADAQADGSRKIFFHPLSSTKEFEVSNKILQNETAATSPENYNDFELTGDRGENSQAAASIYDPTTGILFYTQVNKDGLACWNTKKALIPENTATFSQCSEVLVFPNDIKITQDGMIWILSNRFPIFQYSTMNSSDINYRILSVSVQEAIKGTICTA